MRIIRFQTANIKRISVAEIDANRYVNRITGANGSGKTSLLDAIEWALVGGKNIPTQPVRRGSVRGTIKIDMGETDTEVTLTRQFFEGSAKRAGRLLIEQKPGGDASEFQDKRKRATTPDEIEDALLKQVSFDPLEFLRMEPKKQYHVLRRISTPEIDMDALDETIQKNFDERTVAGRQRDQLEAQRNAIIIPDNLPTEKRDEKAMLAELAQVSIHNSAIDQEQRRRERITDEIRIALELVQRLQQQLVAAEAAYESLKAVPDTWEPLAEPKDAGALAEEINEARIINKAIDRGAERAKIDTQYATVHAEWSRLDAEVKEGERKKKEAIAHAKYPVEGLGFGNQEVMYNGLPFDQASNGEQIRVSAAIGMTTNSKVRVMRIKDGSLLDEASLGIIADMAHEHDFQVWIEQCDETGNIGIYMEEGEIKTINSEPLDERASAGKKGAKKQSGKKKTRATDRVKVEEKTIL